MRILKLGRFIFLLTLKTFNNLGIDKDCWSIYIVLMIHSQPFNKGTNTMKETAYLRYMQKTHKMLESERNPWFHYDLQVWIKDGIIQDCGHPQCRDKTKTVECNAHKYQGKSLKEI